ncbi:MAG: glycosyltransferase family 2 protein [Patescibacteria group bacterium]|nr:glycosyltransferase family 2 protein [Patescibacteria group bacterium]
MRKKLSLCLAVFNEEKNIHYPLDSAIDIVDEVVIVDGGSTDRTVEITKSYGKKVRIIKSDNPSMFHLNKQKAIEEARGEWILQLDADEELSKELKEEIKKVTHGKTSEVKERSGKTSEVNEVAYWIPRKNWFLTRFLMKGGQYPDYTLRLYKNGYARFPCRDVHENVKVINPKSKILNPKQIQNSNDKNSKPETKTQKFENSNIENSLKTENYNLKIGYLQNPILHYADPDFSRYLMRWDRYTTLEVQNAKFKSQNEEKNLVLMFFEYFFWKPLITFFSMYIRHKGFLDGFPGFVFALFSSIRFWVVYIKFWKIRKG